MSDIERVGDLYEAGPGCILGRAVRSVIEVADGTGQVTFLNFNDTIIRVEPGSHHDDLVFQYRKARSNDSVDL